LNQIFARHTGQTLETIQKDTDRDHFLGSEEAKAYGLIDEVLSERQGMFATNKNYKEKKADAVAE
jgi:ATP-dependent Clp protease protease subunit